MSCFPTWLININLLANYNMPSIGEIVIIILVGFLVIKPEDIPQITKFLSSILQYVNNLKRDIHAKIQTASEDDHNLVDHVDEINFYLTKVADLGLKYDGEYNLDHIRNFYYDAIKKAYKSVNQD